MRVKHHRSEVHSPPQDDPGEPALRELLRQEIEDTGPITFARFMQRALYEPGLGYYASSAERTGRAGDFLTAPELHPIFGQALARQVDEMWTRLDRPASFTLREYGAGSGALVVALLDGLARLGSPLATTIRFQPVDLAPQVARIAQRLAAAGAHDRIEPVVHGDRFVGCVVANEFLDALPVHRIEGGPRGRLRELYVGWRDGRFIEVAGDLSDPRLADWFADSDIVLPEGQRAEVNLAMGDWVGEVARDLQRGYALIIDYGHSAADLYAPARSGGTVRAFRGQHVSSDVLAGVGRQDLTAHVDLDALARAARSAGLDVLGHVSQATFLMGCGLEELYAESRTQADEEWEAALLLRAAVRRLLDPRAMGGYAVVILGTGVPVEPALRGLAHNMAPPA